MKIRWVPALVAISLVGIAAAPSGQATGTTIEQMPPKLETQFALSAVPPGLRDRATVHLLHPKKGYHLSRQGTSGVTCIVERTAWELSDLRAVHHQRRHWSRSRSQCSLQPSSSVHRQAG